MKKPLHQPKEIFRSQRGGQVRTFNPRNAEDYIEDANGGLHGVDPEIEARDHWYANVCRELCKWMKQYDEHGVSSDLVKRLNRMLRDIRFSKHLQITEDGEVESAYIADFNKNLTPAEVAADIFSKLLTIGALARLKRCQLPNCKRFFRGPRQAKWCSDSCGSKFRVREKRRRDGL